MNADGASLLNFLDAPVVVGDPEGRVVYANPAFEEAFHLGSGQAQGEELAALFAGGGREAILRAVAEVCARGQTVHFRLREGGGGYLALASPIEAADDRVGVVILLTDEPLADARLLAFHREVQEPLDEISQTLEELLDQTGGRRQDKFRMAVERGLGAVARARKWSDELHRLISGSAAGQGSSTRLDPVRVVGQIASHMEQEFQDAGVSLDLLVPAQLPQAKGDPALLETAVVRLLRHRLKQQSAGGMVTLSARAAGSNDQQVMLIGVVDLPGEGAAADGARDEPRVVREAIAALGGRTHTVCDPVAGRATCIQLAVVSR